MTIKTLADLPAATHAERLEVITQSYITNQFAKLAVKIQRGTIRDTKSYECAIGFDATAHQMRLDARYGNLRAQLEARHAR